MVRGGWTSAAVGESETAVLDRERVDLGDEVRVELASCVLERIDVAAVDLVDVRPGAGDGDDADTFVRVFAEVAGGGIAGGVAVEEQDVPCADGLVDVDDWRQATVVCLCALGLLLEAAHRNRDDPVDAAGDQAAEQRLGQGR